MSKAIKFGAALKEIRIHLCQTGKSSCGVRNFIEQHYVDLKLTNPNFPILIRECSGIQPKLWVRREKGKETCTSLKDLDAEEVFNQIGKLTC